MKHYYIISIILTLLQCEKLYVVQFNDLREINKGNDGSVEVLHWRRLPDQIWHHNRKYTEDTARLLFTGSGEIKCLAVCHNQSLQVRSFFLLQEAMLFILI